MLHMGVEYSIFKILKKAGERRPGLRSPRFTASRLRKAV